MSKKKLLFLGILMLFVGLGLWFYYRQETDSWQIYENSRYGFQVPYPSGWRLGEEEVNNAGREFYSSDGKSQCYAYGFANALEQSLDEFLGWMTEGEELVDQRETMLAGRKAVAWVVKRDDNKIQEAVYALDEDMGWGLYCIYDNQKLQKSFSQDFEEMRKGFVLEEVVLGGQNCSSYLNGVFEPAADRQTFETDEYTSVTLTERDFWDRALLPQQVVDLESDNYVCTPLPLEFEEVPEEIGINVQPEVKLVEWNCDKAYENYYYINRANLERKNELEAEGYVCGEQACQGEEAEDFVWFCFK